MCTQALGMPSMNNIDSNKNQQTENSKSVVQKRQHKSVNNDKEIELRKVINGMKGKIDELFQMIEIICSAIVHNDVLKKNIDNLLLISSNYYIH